MLLIGRNSVRPWTTPRMPASTRVIRPPRCREAYSPDLDDHGPVTGTVELHEHHALPGAQAQSALAYRDRLARPQDGCLDVGRRVIVHAIVAPRALGDHATQGVQDVLAHVGVG